MGSWKYGAQNWREVKAVSQMGLRRSSRTKLSRPGEKPVPIRAEKQRKNSREKDLMGSFDYHEVLQLWGILWE